VTLDYKEYRMAESKQMTLTENLSGGFAAYLPKRFVKIVIMAFE
jgi:hypothetical protein